MLGPGADDGGVRRLVMFEAQRPAIDRARSEDRLVMERRRDYVRSCSSRAIRDNVSMKVDAVVYFNAVNPERAIIQVQSYLPATKMLAQTTLRAVNSAPPSAGYPNSSAGSG